MMNFGGFRAAANKDSERVGESEGEKKKQGNPTEKSAPPPLFTAEAETTAPPLFTADVFAQFRSSASCRDQ